MRIKFVMCSLCVQRPFTERLLNSHWTVYEQCLMLVCKPFAKVLQVFQEAFNQYQMNLCQIQISLREMYLQIRGYFITILMKDYLGFCGHSFRLSVIRQESISNLEKANIFLIRSFREAPIWYTSLSSTIRKRSWLFL